MTNRSINFRTIHINTKTSRQLRITAELSYGEYFIFRMVKLIKFCSYVTPRFLNSIIAAAAPKISAYDIASQINKAVAARFLSL